MIVAAPVGRDDPGSFDVTVTWAPPATSRSHIVTVWKVTAAADDYLERFDADAVAYVVAASAPPEFILPGNGPVTVALAAGRQPVDVDAPTRTIDITIAQSLAEEGTGPYGAILDDADGQWNYPPNAPPQPAPGLLVTPMFVDDFERANGPLGANWPAPVQYPTALDGPAGTPTISAGATVSGTNIEAFAYYATPIPGDHYIEVEIADWHQIGTATARRVEVMLLTRWAGPADLTCAAARWSMAAAQDGGLTRTGYFEGAAASLAADTFISPADTFRLRLESTVAGHHRLLVDDILATEFDETVGVGDYVGFAMWWNFAGTSPRILSASVGTAAAVRKTSWVAGWRVGVASDTVMVADVNTGVDNIQSTQAALVVESAEVSTGWRVIDYDLAAAVGGVTPAGVLTLNNPPRPGTFLVVLVGVTASTDIIDTVTVTGVDLTRSHVQHKSGASWGQGAIYTGLAPLDFDPASWALVVTHPDVESVSAVVYKVANPDETTPVGGVASGVLGTAAAGSVDGPSTITMSAPGDPAGVALAFLHVSTGDDDTSGAATSTATKRHEEVEHSPATRRAYLHTMSRAPGQPESTSTTVQWADVQTGDATTFSGVELAVEVRPSPDAASAAGQAGVWLGGLTDPWDGTIDTAGAYNPDGAPDLDVPLMAWTGPPGSIIYPVPGTTGTICPQGWDEDFDRSQMSTQVLIARQPPANIPRFVFNLTPTPDSTPAAGTMSADPNQEAATRLWVSKTTVDSIDATIWLGYLNRHSSVTFTSPANDGADPPIPETSRTYELTADVVEHAAHYEVPVTWTGGTAHVPSGWVWFDVSVGQEVPQLWFDAYGVEHYGRMTFSRTDLINTDRDLFVKLADRILEVRGSNSVPRIEAVTIDARTGASMANMRMMSDVRPEKPSRYRMALEVGDRVIYDRMCFATAVRHFIAPNEWTLRVTLDIAEWAAQL